jgi:hypothetical protein
MVRGGYDRLQPTRRHHFYSNTATAPTGQRSTTEADSVTVTSITFDQRFRMK